jgi:hypothetical protein
VICLGDLVGVATGLRLEGAGVVAVDSREAVVPVLAESEEGEGCARLWARSRISKGSDFGSGTHRSQAVRPIHMSNNASQRRQGLRPGLVGRYRVYNRTDRLSHQPSSRSVLFVKIQPVDGRA